MNVTALLLALALFLQPPLQSEPDDPLSERRLPLSPEVQVDTLDNGLVYYIQPNDEPSERAELRLVVNAGSVLEEEHERGVAHFVEHLLFNGTERFEEQEIVNFLERIGMRFGPDVNAYTSADETVYQLTIPTDDEEIVETSFEILEDWSSAATLSDEAVEKERGIIIEEWRARFENASGRMQEKIRPVLFHESHYLDRSPIGDTAVIRNAEPETFRSFYERWYRPDLMAVVAVGDFNADDIEERIEEHFGHLTAPEDAPERSTFDIPGHEETLFAIATDPEYPVSQVEVTYKREAVPAETAGDYRERLKRSLFRSMLNTRLSEIARQGDAPFVSARAYEGNPARPATFYGLGAQVYDDSLLTGMQAMLTEAERVRQHGFTDSEFERQKERTLRNYRRAYDERESTRSSDYVERYVDHFLEQRPVPGTEYEYELAQELLPEITLDEVNELSAQLLAEHDRVVLVRMPERSDRLEPTEEMLAGVLEHVQEQEVEPYVDETPDAPLMAEIPSPAEVTGEERFEELDVTEITLENGVRVVYKQTDFKRDEVQLSAFSPGGTSLAEDEDYFDAAYAATIVGQSGVGDFDQNALERLLSGQVVNVSPYIDELEQGFRGSASPEDLETLFQLIHRYMTDPRADEDALASFQNQQRAFLQNRDANPMGAFQDSLVAALYDGDLRRRVPTIEELEAIELDTAHQFFRERFADAGDFTFVFVGNLEPEQLTHLAQTYLGTLPSSQLDTMWQDVAPDRPEGVVEKTAYEGESSQSQVALLFHGPFDYTRENRHALRSLEDALSIRLREALREERSGVYGVQVEASSSHRPDERYQFVVSFTCDPERIDELTEAVFEEIQAYQDNGVPEETLATVKEQQRRDRETELEENGFWTGSLAFHYRYGEEDVRNILRYQELIDAISEEDVQEAARTFLNTDRYVNVRLLPEAYAQGEAED